MRGTSARLRSHCSSEEAGRLADGSLIASILVDNVTIILVPWSQGLPFSTRDGFENMLYPDSSNTSRLDPQLALSR